MLVISGSWSLPAAAAGLGRVPGPGLPRVPGAGVGGPGSACGGGGSPMAAAPARAPPRTARREIGRDSPMTDDTKRPPGSVLGRRAPGAPGRPVACAPWSHVGADRGRRPPPHDQELQRPALDPAVVDDLLTAALSAPSAGNTQGREFVVLEGPEETSPYWGATTDAALAGRLPSLRRPGPGPGGGAGLRRSRGVLGPVPGAGQGPGRRAPRSSGWSPTGWWTRHSPP